MGVGVGVGGREHALWIHVGDKSTGLVEGPLRHLDSYMLPQHVLTVCRYARTNQREAVERRHVSIEHLHVRGTSAFLAAWTTCISADSAL